MISSAELRDKLQTLVLLAQNARAGALEDLKASGRMDPFRLNSAKHTMGYTGINLDFMLYLLFLKMGSACLANFIREELVILYVISQRGRSGG